MTRDAADLRAADHILLPGVGAFADAMAKLEATGLVPVLREETQKSRCSASAWVCSFCLKKAMSTVHTAALGLSPARSARWRMICATLRSRCPTSAGTPWTLCPGARPTRCSSISKSGEYVYYVHSYYAKNLRCIDTGNQ